METTKTAVIIRFFKEDHKIPKIIKENVPYEKAKKYCNSPISMKKDAEGKMK